MSSTLGINAEEFEKLQELMKRLPDGAEEAINEVLHNEGGQLISEAVRLLIPESGKTWRGKGAAAKSGNSLTTVNGNLAVTVKSTKKYGYLYFPDDGTNTRRHVGNQQFFLAGAENVSDDIIERCTVNLTNLIEGD